MNARVEHVSSGTTGGCNSRYGAAAASEIGKGQLGARPPLPGRPPPAGRPPPGGGSRRPPGRTGSPGGRRPAAASSSPARAAGPTPRPGRTGTPGRPSTRPASSPPACRPGPPSLRGGGRRSGVPAAQVCPSCPSSPSAALMFKCRAAARPIGKRPEETVPASPGPQPRPARSPRPKGQSCPQYRKCGRHGPAGLAQVTVSGHSMPTSAHGHGGTPSVLRLVGSSIGACPDSDPLREEDPAGGRVQLPTGANGAAPNRSMKSSGPDTSPTPSITASRRSRWGTEFRLSRASSTSRRTGSVPSRVSSSAATAFARWVSDPQPVEHQLEHQLMVGPAGRIRHVMDSLPLTPAPVSWTPGPGPARRPARAGC